MHGNIGMTAAPTSSGDGAACHEMVDEFFNAPPWLGGRGRAFGLEELVALQTAQLPTDAAAGPHRPL